MMIHKKLLQFTLFLIALGLIGCSTVGPGFLNHPGDCAMGIPWADCLPGTPGYNNGGGKLHREEATKQNSAIIDQFKAANDQCKIDMSVSVLDPIRHKVELVKYPFDAAPAFEVASIDEFPNAVEKEAISKWGTIRDGCIMRDESISFIPPASNAISVAFMQQQKAFLKEARARISELIVALYHSKLTYGEFATKRYEISKSAVDAERQYRESMILADQQRQQQAQQLAQQQFQNNLQAWSTYMQSVNARQPQTVYINGSVRLNTNCTSQHYGNTVTTNCN